jgi:hypothetical protein
MSPVPPAHRGAEAGDPAAVHHELAYHGDLSFLLEADETFPGGSPESPAWLEQLRRSGGA